MFGAIPLRGARGAIRWCYHIAAGVTNFEVTYSKERQAWTLRGAVVSPNAYQLQQRPLDFMAPTGAKTGLSWPVIDLTIKDGKIVANLGNPGNTTHEPIRST